MTAEEARKLSDLNKNDDITDVLSRITEQAGKGEVYTFYCKKLSFHQKEELIRLGYHLSEESDDFFNGYLIKISW